MESILIKPSKLNGTITIPPSKSMSHRAIICASLCSDGDESIIDNVILSDDIEATIGGMKQLGAEINITEKNKNTYSLKIKRKASAKIDDATISCNESGSTLRFLIPVAMALSEKCTFTGKGKLIERPLDIYYNIFDEHHIQYENNEGILPLKVNGRFEGGCYRMSGSVSSQFISGLLFALPLAENDSKIIITDKMESSGYVDLTIDMLKKFNINIENINYHEFIIRGNSRYKPANYSIEGDYSQAAFFMTAHAIGNSVNVEGLRTESLQGDKEIINIIKKYEENCNEITIDASQIPDLVPIMTVLAALKDGKTTRIINAERLRIKESDRLKSIASEMNKLGADVSELADGLLIKGQRMLHGNATVNSWNDHRIAMSLSIAATKCEHEIVLENYKTVNKSYPDFWNDYKALGGIIHELHMGK